jgi:hypothetical protein
MHTSTQAREFGAIPLLPTPQELIEKLNALGRARDAGHLRTAQRIVNEITDMVRPGVYEGYPGEDLRFSYCKVLSVKCRNETDANIYTFFVEFLDLWGDEPGKIQNMDLMEFLTPVHRKIKGSGEAQHVGPRFWKDWQE